MIVISHRGNVNGSDSKLENNPDHILTLLEKQIDVEVDVWYIEESFYLGHDFAQYKIEKEFLLNKRLWCHAKNLEAFERLLDLKTVCFWHQEDDYTLTSNGFIWTYPNKFVSSKSIIVDTNSQWSSKNYSCYGVCVDYLLDK